MKPSDIVNACAPGMLAEVTADERLEVRSAPGRLWIETGRATVRRSQQSACLFGALVAVSGIALLWYSIWGLTVLALGLVTAFMVPRYLRPVRLLEIDTAARQLNVIQSPLGAGASLPLDRIQHIRGEYDTKGWSGFSVLYAVDSEEMETAILVLLGTDDQLAETACKVLSALLTKPSSYSGSFGRATVCFEPRQLETQT
jgi:hypothetical protein